MSDVQRPIAESAAPDRDCYTLANGECISPYCRLHGPVDFTNFTTERLDHEIRMAQQTLSALLRERGSRS